jgi:c-di-GMP-binding flagellar brake protein YcgR
VAGVGDEWREIPSSGNVELSMAHAGNVAQFRTVIRDRTESALILLMPSSEQAQHILVKDAVVDVTVSLKEKMLKFTTLIVDRKIIREPLLYLMRPHQMSTVGQRSFYRFQVARPLKVRLMRDEVTPISEFKPATTLDLSGGGLMIQGKLNIPKDHFAEINLDLNGINVNAVCRVNVAKTEEHGGSEVYLTGLEFVAIEERERDKIMKFIFDSQRQLKKKGLII